MLQTSLGTYIIGAVFIIAGIGLFLKGRTKPPTQKEEKVYGTLRVTGAMLIGVGVLLALSEWIFAPAS